MIRVTEDVVAEGRLSRKGYFYSGRTGRSRAVMSTAHVREISCWPRRSPRISSQSISRPQCALTPWVSPIPGHDRFVIASQYLDAIPAFPILLRADFTKPKARKPHCASTGPSDPRCLIGERHSDDLRGIRSSIFVAQPRAALFHRPYGVTAVAPTTKRERSSLGREPMTANILTIWMASQPHPELDWNHGRSVD